jgi:hypothetical protein
MLDEPLDWDAVEDKDGMIGRIMETNMSSGPMQRS